MLCYTFQALSRPTFRLMSSRWGTLICLSCREKKTRELILTKVFSALFEAEGAIVGGKATSRRKLDFQPEHTEIPFKY